jgi:hypothetical protein
VASRRGARRTPSHGGIESIVFWNSDDKFICALPGCSDVHHYFSREGLENAPLVLAAA